MRRKTYRTPHRRRLEGKTDYRRRLELLKSKKTRLVVRKSTNSVTCQLISYDPKGDRTAVTVNYSSLKKLGWKGHGGSVPSAYLVGFLCGTAAKKKKISAAVADLGLYHPTKWSRLYAALQGVVDAGLEIPHAKDILLPKERVNGQHISSYAEKLKKESPDEYNKTFSGYLKKKLAPEQLPKHFEEIKKKIS